MASNGAVSKKTSKRVRVSWRDPGNTAPITVYIDGKMQHLQSGEVYDLPLHIIKLLKSKRVPKRETFDAPVTEKMRKMNTTATWEAGRRIADERVFIVEPV